MYEQMAAKKPGDAFTIDDYNQMLANFAYLYSMADQSAGAQEVPNPSFEIDSDGVHPDDWTVSFYPGGSGQMDGNNNMHGALGYTFTNPGGAGNGGGYLTSDYIACAGLPGALRSIGFFNVCSAAGVHCQLQLDWYDAAKNHISTVWPYDSGTGIDAVSPTAPTFIIRAVPAPPPNARYFTVTLIGGNTDGAAGTATFDGVMINAPGFAPGNIIFAEANTEDTGTNTAALILKEIQVYKGGSVNVSFNLRTTYGGTAAHGQVYVNNSPVGPLQSTTSTNYVTFTQAINGLKPGDLIELYTYVDGGGASWYANNFQVLVSSLEANTVTKS